MKMRKDRIIIIITILCFMMSAVIKGQDLERIKNDSSYLRLKNEVIEKFRYAQPGAFGPFVHGVDEDINTKNKVMALTFDACGGPHGSGYDEALIAFLTKRKIPATLFLTGLWIDEHPDLVRTLAANPLFEIENHGLTHHPCAIDGETKYGIHGTTSVGDAVDEVELNARKIEFYTRHKPSYYRSATATTDEACAEIARQLGETIISYDLLSGDAVAGTPTNVIKNNLIHGARHGAIIIMHMNHPEWNGFEALKAALPVLQKEGYTFVKLANHPLVGKK